ncbi:MAG TPA: hypothetical protein VJM51_01455, partial [Dehalococcoidia bacterium]|nr:hypothetical protein [Dehalococcoidia bacterium]
MQNTIARERSHWRWIGRWSWATLGFNNGWLRRFTTFIMGIVILSLATVALADTTDYDVMMVRINGTELPGTVVHPFDSSSGDYDYVLNDNGGPKDGLESGHMSSVKLSDGGTPATAYPSLDGYNGPLPGDLLMGDVVEVDVDMAA